MLFRDEAPVLDATKTRVDDLAQISSSTYSTIPNVHATVGVEFRSFPILAATVTTPLFVVPYPILVLGVVSRFETASSSGTYQIELTPSGTAAGSGTNILTGTVALSGTAATNAFGTLTTLSGGGSGAPGVKIPAGNALSIVIAGTMTSLAGASVTIYFVRSGI